MRKYYTESVGSLLKKMKEDLQVVELYQAQEELKALWCALPDATLQKLNVSFEMGEEGNLKIVAPSTVALNYIRRQRSLILRSFANYMTEHHIAELIITQR